MLRHLRAQFSAEEIARRIRRAERSGFRILMARDGDEDVGVVTFGPIDDVCWGRTLYVHDLVAHPTRRGQGIGGRLLEAVFSLARAEGFDHVRLCSGLERHDAHRFYEAHGMTCFSKQFKASVQGDP